MCEGSAFIAEIETILLFSMVILTLSRHTPFLTSSNLPQLTTVVAANAGVAKLQQAMASAIDFILFML
jgi:hypothetical protein